MTKEPVQPCTTIIVGETGVGKTTQNVNEIDLFVSNFNGKQPGKAVLLDINDEELYQKYRTLNPTPENILAFVRQPLCEARRVACIKKDGTPMNAKEIMETAMVLIRNFKIGLFGLDDLDKVQIFSKNQDIVGMLMGNRHQGMDVMISKQSMGMVSTYEFRNMTWLRLHKTVDSVKSVKDRVVNYRLVRIAELIVDEQYHEAKNIRYFVYIQMRKNLIVGCSRAAFNRACRKYIYESTNEIRDEINIMLAENVITTKQKNQQETQKMAVDRLIKRYQRFIPENITK